MAIVEKSVLVLFSAQQMFDLVQDVQAYPQFLPWCGGARAVTLSENSMEASVQIAFKGICQNFTTLNTYQRPHRIVMVLKEGPFRSLHGQWDFVILQEAACKVRFTLEYAFSSKILEHVIGPVFNNIANSFVDSFIERAELVYGTGGIGS